MENRTISIPLFAVSGVLLVVVCIWMFRSVTGGIQDRLARQQAELARQSAVDATNGGGTRNGRVADVGNHVAQIEWLKTQLKERTEELDRLTAEHSTLQSRFEDSQTIGAELLAQLLQSESTARSAAPSRNATGTLPVNQPQPAGTENSSETGQLTQAEQVAAERLRFDAELMRIQDQLERGLAVMFEERYVVQNALSDALIDTGAASAPALVELLMNERSEVRVWAAYVIGEIGPPAAGTAPALREALSDPNEAVRRQAAQALEALGPEGGVQ